MTIVVGTVASSGSVSGFDLGHPDVAEVEHWLREHAAVLADPGVVACTHLVPGVRPRVALSVAGVDPWHLSAGEPIDPAVASAAAVEHYARRSGRAVVFPGVGAMVGTVSVGDVLTRTAVERVLVLGGPQPGIDVLIDTRDFVRPQWRDGLLTLITTPAPDGHIAPFEVPNPTPCCESH
jgi:hypothetical protein